MDLWELFIVALMPNLKMLLITAAGSLLALERFDILGNTAGKNLNTVSFIRLFVSKCWLLVRREGNVSFREFCFCL